MSVARHGDDGARAKTKSALSEIERSDRGNVAAAAAAAKHVTDAGAVVGVGLMICLLEFQISSNVQSV